LVAEAIARTAGQTARDGHGVTRIASDAVSMRGRSADARISHNPFPFKRLDVKHGYCEREDDPDTSL
jgi:hypothetical protein